MVVHSNEIVLIRELPGSGKTTMAKNDGGYVHLESDMYLEVNGVYIYDSFKIREAHLWCLASTKQAFEQGMNVVESNAFVQLWELQWYIDRIYTLI